MLLPLQPPCQLSIATPSFEGVVEAAGTTRPALLLETSRLKRLGSEIRLQVARCDGLAAGAGARISGALATGACFAAGLGVFHLVTGAGAGAGSTLVCGEEMSTYRSSEECHRGMNAEGEDGE